MADIVVKGRQFVSNKQNNDVYLRTDSDINQFYYYDASTDNASWTSEIVYESTFNGTLTTDATVSFDSRVKGDSFIYVDGMDISTSVLTTNDSDNFWTIQLRTYSGSYPGGISNQVASNILTDSDSPSSDFTDHDADVSISSPNVGPAGVFAFTATATGTPGSLTVLANVRYRKVRT